MATKLRKRETLGFRPENDAQEKLILDAQEATGITMAELLRRAVLRGLPTVVEEIRKHQARAFEMFDKQLVETESQPAASNPGPYKLSRKPLKKVS